MNKCITALRMLFIVPSLLAVIYANPVSLTRYALVIGSNTGSEDRVELKYAVSDARSFAGILTEMGGVSKERCIVTANPDRQTLLGEFDRLQQIVDGEKTLSGRKEAIVYYSGHADAMGIILGTDRYTYKEMLQNLRTIGVDVSIAVLDACASGSLTREKGGTHRQPFLYDISTEMQGHAYLTSSSSDEASQESDAIKSSFFTHYLISGMRGPADGNSDGKVTLNEAYEFAYDETLQRTEKTKAGPQHAAYDIRLKGSGDLVLTDLRTSSSLLRLMPPVHGRIYIHDAQGRLLVEMLKNAGKKLEIGLEPGKFDVVVSDGDDVTAATVTLTEGHAAEVSGAELHAVKQLRHRVRGTSPAPADSSSYVHIPMNLSLLPTISINGIYQKTLTNGSLSLLAGKTDKLSGLEITSGISIVAETTVGGQIAAVACLANDVTGLQIAGAINLADGNYQGFQLASALNYAGKGVRGFQLSGAVNLACGDVSGMQISGAINHALGDARAIQIASVYNYVNGGALGIQIAGAYNYVTGSAKGAHLAGAFNYVKKSAVGLQIAGGANITSLPFTGLLIAGGMNCTEKTTGLQIAGGVNICGECRGLQIASINMCRNMSGMQIGVVNICDTMSGVPIAVFNYVRKIPPRYRVSVDEAGFVQVTVRSGADNIYSLLSLGTSTSHEKYQWTYGFGLGGRMAVGNGYFALESTVHNIHENTIWDEDAMMHIQNALIYNHRVAQRLCLWGGPTFNLGIAWDKGKERVSYQHVTYEKYQHHWFAAWPGFTGGIEL
jgi:hypothetical protein